MSNVIDLHPVGDGWEDLPLTDNQRFAIMEMCECIAKVAASSGNTDLMMRATKLYYNLSNYCA